VATIKAGHEIIKSFVPGSFTGPGSLPRTMQISKLISSIAAK
jgi:hypothetical protein